MPTKFFKAMTKPVAGLSVFALMGASWSSTAVAQLPTIQPQQLQQAPLNNRLQQLQQIPRSNPSNQLQSAYILGGGDRVVIDIFQVPQYSGEYQVPVDGILYLPLIGGISVQDLTLVQATNAISSAYSRFLKRPIVTVRLLSPRPINVFVSGEVNRPGSFTLNLTGGAGDRPGVQYPTLTQALVQAGGVTLAADISQIQVRRRRAGGGADQQFAVDFQSLLQAGDRTQDLTLRDGDTIFIPPVTAVNLPQTRQLATASFAADPNRARTVAVVGEVKRPGSYILIGTATDRAGIIGGLPTVSLALQLAQGIRPLADIRNIQIRRQTIAGEQIIPVNLWQLLQSGDFSQDAILQEGDTVVVPKATEIPPAEAVELAQARFAPDTIRVSVVGEVKAPATLQVPPNTTLNQALLNAGGFNDSRARRGSVELIRLNPNGTISKENVPVDFAQGANAKNNPILRDNDIVVVSRSNTARVADVLNLFFSPGAGIINLLTILGIR
jgi:polysaccharide biosynthesis/export protein